MHGCENAWLHKKLGESAHFAFELRLRLLSSYGVRLCSFVGGVYILMWFPMKFVFFQICPNVGYHQKKRHLTPICLFQRNGANFSVFLNTSSEFDGSDSGARPDEAVSWGKIRMDAKPVKIYAEASLVFPLLVAETFARRYHKLDQKQEEK